MNITIQTIHCTVSESMKERIKKRLQKLSTYYHAISRADISLHEEKGDPQKSQSIDIKLHIQGPYLHASHQSHSFEIAASKAIESLRKQLQKLKSTRTENA